MLYYLGHGPQRWVAVNLIWVDIELIFKLCKKMRSMLVMDTGHNYNSCFLIELTAGQTAHN